MEKKILFLALLLLIPGAASDDKKIPENMTLRIDGLEGDFYTEEGRFAGTATDLSYPYIVAEHSGMVSGIVGYGRFIELQRSGNTVSMTQETTGFLLPFTSGDRSVIEDRRESVVAWDFLGTSAPSFAFTEKEPTVRIALAGDYSFTGSNRQLRNGEITIRNDGSGVVLRLGD